MADIAFLLLIFFLVTTTIDQDEGLLDKLAPIEKEKIILPAKERNVLKILVNSNDEIKVEDKIVPVELIHDLLSKHIKNNGFDANYSESPQKAIVFLQSSKGTSYDIYLRIQNELKLAYNIIRNEEALAMTNSQFDYVELKKCIELKGEDLSYCKTVKEEIKKKFPMIISEAQPVASR